jgi:hypothetical protein
MIAPLAKLIDWLAIQTGELVSPAGDRRNPRLAEAIQFLNSSDFLGAPRPLFVISWGFRESSLFANGSSQPMQSTGKAPVNLEGNCVCQMVRDWALRMSHSRFVGSLNGRGKGAIKEPIAQLPLHTTGPREHSSPECGIGAFAQ